MHVFFHLWLICVLNYYQILVFLSILPYFILFAFLLTIFIWACDIMLHLRKALFCLSCVNSKPYQSVTYSSWSGSYVTFYRAWATFCSHICSHVASVMGSDLSSHAMCLYLASWFWWMRVTLLLSSPSLFEELSWAIYALESAVNNEHILSCSACIVHIKISSNFLVCFYIWSHWYCSLVTRVLHMYFVFCIISLSSFITLIM